LVLTVPLDVRGRLTLATELAHHLVGLVQDVEAPLLGIGLGARVERNLRHRLLAGGREDRGLRLRAGEEATEAVAEADAMRHPERVLGDAVVDLELWSEAVGESAGSIGVVEPGAQREPGLDPVLATAVQPRPQTVGLIDLDRDQTTAVEDARRQTAAQLRRVG